MSGRARGGAGPVRSGERASNRELAAASLEQGRGVTRGTLETQAGDGQRLCLHDGPPPAACRKLSSIRSESLEHSCFFFRAGGAVRGHGPGRGVAVPSPRSRLRTGSSVPVPTRHDATTGQARGRYSEWLTVAAVSEPT